MDPKPVQLNNGRKLGGYFGKPRDVRVGIENTKGKTNINVPLSFGASTKTQRALVKIAAEYLCWAEGREAASSAISGAVADFVVKGRGHRPVILFNPDSSNYRHHFGQTGKIKGSGWFCIFRLAHFHVCVDLTHDLFAFRGFAAALYDQFGSKDWTTLPTSAAITRNGALELKVS